MLQREIVHTLGISTMTLHRWRKATPAPAAGAAQSREPGMERVAAELEIENSRLRRLVVDLLLEKVELEEAKARLPAPRQGRAVNFISRFPTSQRHLVEPQRLRWFAAQICGMLQVFSARSAVQCALHARGLGEEDFTIHLRDMHVALFWWSRTEESIAVSSCQTPSFILAQSANCPPGRSEVLDRLQAENAQLRGQAIDLILPIQLGRQPALSDG
jgi:putative transposase